MAAFVHKLAKKLATRLGEQDAHYADVSSHEPLSKMLDVDIAQFHKILPYRYYDTENGLFVNEHSFGFGFELALLSGANEELVRSLDKVLRSYVPEGMDMQFIFCGTNKVGEVISQNMISQSALGGIFAENAKVAHDYYIKSAKQGFVSKSKVPATLRDYRLFFFISKRMRYTQKNITLLLDCKEDLKSQLKTAGLESQHIDALDFISVVRDLLISRNPNDLGTPKVQFAEHDELNKQVVHSSFELVADDGGKWLDTKITDRAGVEHESRLLSLSVEKMPDTFSLWMAADNFCSAFNAAKAITCPFVISLSARIEPLAASKALAQRKYLGLDKKANSPYAKMIPGTVKAAQEWKQVRDQLNSDEVKLCRAYTNLLLFSNKEDYRRDEANAIASFGGNGFELSNIKYLQLQNYLATLPFMLSEGMYEDLSILGEKRLKRMTTWNLVNLLPLVADFKGAQSGVLAPTFRHQVAFLNPHDKNMPVTNYNISICAAPGGGKSLLSQAIIASTLAKDGFVFVIDLGESYKKTCETLGGQYINYSSLGLNPFAGVKNIDDEIETIKQILALMISPESQLDDYQKTMLEDAILQAFKLTGTKTKISDVLAILEAMHKEEVQAVLKVKLKYLITPLSAYTPDKAKGEVFARESLLGSTSNFVVLELQELEEKPELMRLVLFSIMSLINRKFYLTERSIPKLCVIDEAWRFFTGEDEGVKKFINTGVRTARKHNGSYVIITQILGDFFKNDTTEAIWNCSEYKYIMYQNPTAFNDLVAEKPNLFDGYQQRMIKHFKPAQANGFSEFMVQAGATYSFHRLFVDPFARVLFSTAPEEFQAVKDLQAQGLPLDQAISQVAKANYPQDFTH